MHGGPSTSLKSRTYVGLVLSQFLAAFNDQATHIVAIFYGGDVLARYAKVGGLNEIAVIAIVTMSFIAPFAIFSPLAGVLADRYSKRTILVAWKLAEVAIMGLALVGFLLPHLPGVDESALPTLATWSAILVIGAVFLMGTHSAFFVPAKYGIMPEILHPSILSRGNGILEGTSFVSQILGTAFGGGLYSLYKSQWSGPNGVVLGQEWVIGAILFGLAVVGALAAFVIQYVPPAAPHRPLIWNPFTPLAANLRILRRSRPLTLSVVGIAFFLFMTLFLRQTLIYEGEKRKEIASAPHANHVDSNLHSDDLGTDAYLVADASEAQMAEWRIARLVALVGLGVGIGSVLAGHLSGKKLELGLVPVGGVFIAITAVAMALTTHSGVATVVCLLVIGVAAGLYIVPLYTLLQHRAPKDSKGNMVATSNFLNVIAGGLMAVVVYTVLAYVFEAAVGDDPQQQLQYVPRLLFLTAGALTVLMLFVLRWLLPDFFLRSLLWMRWYGRKPLEVMHVHHLPSDGLALLATNGRGFSDAMRIIAACDRHAESLVVLAGDDELATDRLTRWLAKRSGSVVIPPGEMCSEDLRRMKANLHAAVRRGVLVALVLEIDTPRREVLEMLDEFRAESSVPVIPVACVPVFNVGPGPTPVRVIFGEPLDRDATLEEIRQALDALAAEPVENTGAMPAMLH